MTTVDQLADRLSDQAGAALVARCSWGEWPAWLHENSYQSLLGVELLTAGPTSVWAAPTPRGHGVARAFLKRHPEQVRAVAKRFGDVGLGALLARIEAGHAKERK